MNPAPPAPIMLRILFPPSFQQLLYVGYMFAVMVREPTGDIRGASGICFRRPGIIDRSHPRVVVVSHLAQLGGQLIVRRLHLAQRILALSRLPRVVSPHLPV